MKVETLLNLALWAFVLVVGYRLFWAFVDALTA